MNSCTMRPEGEGSSKCLTGVLHYDLSKGTILVLRKISETEYHLQAIDKRDGDRTNKSLGSFWIPEDRPHVQTVLGSGKPPLSTSDGTGKT